MSIRFNRCMNLESRFWNFAIFAWVLGIIGGIFFTILLGGLCGVGGGVVSFGVGQFCGKWWHSGKVQRWRYWNLPFAKVISKKIPYSHYRRFH
ncbi:MAG: hypothetical protein HRU35_05550 [Rickettsiaceae bacterium]|nr:hypothetical protein [Rickettsiaceae bacterium]